MDYLAFFPWRKPGDEPRARGGGVRGGGGVFGGVWVLWDGDAVLFGEMDLGECFGLLWWVRGSCVGGDLFAHGGWSTTQNLEIVFRCSTDVFFGQDTHLLA